MKTQDNEKEVDPFLCQCGPCKTFWKANFARSGNDLQRPPIERSAATSMMFETVRNREDHPAVFKIGDRVLVHGKHAGVVKFVGTLDDNLIAPDCYVGVHLDEQVNSSHNGVYIDKRYFHCPRGHGAFVHYHEAVRINPTEKRPPVSGNSMYPSYYELCKQRKQRRQMDPEMDWGPNIRRKEPVIHVQDDKDIALQDQRKNQNHNMRQKQRSKSRTIEEEDKLTRQENNKWKAEFGGDDRAEKMAATLQKLQQAYALGKQETAENQEANHSASSQHKRFNMSRRGQTKM